MLVFNILFTFIPLLLFMGLLIESIKKHPRNGLLIFILFFFTLHIIFNSSKHVIIDAFIDMLLGYVWGLFVLLSLFINAYTIALIYKLLPTNQSYDLDYLIVLGAGLKGTEVQRLLASRINKAIQLFNHNNNLTIIMSGGQGPDEDIAEGIAMAHYARYAGVPSSAILMEVISTNTHENIRNSMQLIQSSSPKIGIVTTYYHTLRAYIVAKELGVDAIIFGSKSTKSVLFVLRAYAREIAAYLYRRINWVLIIVSNYSIYHFYLNSHLYIKCIKKLLFILLN
ncbi:YdcF family protein [Aerococcaceae bacterium WGS1372]